MNDNTPSTANNLGFLTNKKIINNFVGQNDLNDFTTFDRADYSLNLEPKTVTSVIPLKNIVGTPGNDDLFGTNNNDRINGGAGNDNIFGNNGNDIIRGGPGNDNIFGGTGFDTALFNGLYGNYQINTIAGQVSGPDGLDLIFGIERLGFSDRFINLAPPSQGIILGSKWNDTDGDGVWESNESGLENWTIYLDTNNNGQLDSNEKSTSTDKNGHYSFTGLKPGNYIVREVQQEGWIQSTPNEGYYDVSLSSDASPFPVLTDLDFGNYQSSGTISGSKWNDADGDGIWDAGEVGLESWT
ncbi:SdrD B-like domain-containing protein, partial [Oscillatoria salina]|uniref:SdrD B-like domain-containing protein n=1 Tax=Oscillatoria salina TaxID=331517 RepID=UPI0021E2A31B